MKILTVDIGTGTQDIYLYDSRTDMENGFKLVVPSPTMMVHKRVKEATRNGDDLLLTGVTMGGGPSHWAVRDHAKAGYQVYATPDAARTFDDNLDYVESQGIQVVSQDEAVGLPGSVRHIKLLDFDLEGIAQAFEPFGVSLKDLDAVAVAVFDHGAAPMGVSDRQFRFDYLDEIIRSKNRLSAFAWEADQVPPIMTRLQAVVDSVHDLDAPLVVMDTAPAAILGATLDSKVRDRARVMIANIGNFHTLAFRLGSNGIEGVFEHHTGLLDLAHLELLLIALAEGSLTHDEVFGHHGHGALIYEQQPLPFGSGDYDLVVTGPRRGMFNDDTTLRPYFPAPFGDMMITGCFGLLAATADIYPDLAGPIHESLKGVGGGAAPPWEIA